MPTHRASWVSSTWPAVTTRRCPRRAPARGEPSRPRIRDAVRLMLAGPTGDERAADFEPVLAPGGLEIASVVNGAVGLNFPAEVDDSLSHRSALR